MISIVVCSVNDELFQQFSQNVEATIGVPFEIVRVDNKQNVYSICGAYNKGKAECRYDVVCFIHEDVLFETNNWGNKVVDVLKDPAIGMAGILGVAYLSVFRHDCIELKACQGQIREGFRPGHPIARGLAFSGRSVAEVVAIDGVFLASRKNVIDKFRFADDILKGFHGYDLDISLQIRQQYKIVVSSNILLLHLSKGTYNAAYYEAMKAITKKWGRFLPLHIPAYSKKEIQSFNVEYCLRIGEWKPVLKNNLTALRFATANGVLIIWLRQLVKRRIIRIYKKLNPARVH